MSLENISNFISFNVPLHNFDLFNFYRNGKLPRNQIGRSGIQVKKENENFPIMCARFLQNLELGQLNNVNFSGILSQWLYNLSTACFQIELEFGNVGFCGGRKIGVPGEKPCRKQGQEQTTNSTHI